MICIGVLIFGQVGIHTPTPNATLDITAKNPKGTSINVDGLLIPRVDRQRAQSMTGVENSTMIYVDNITTGTLAGSAININSVGYYYSDDSVWVKYDNNTNIYNADGALSGNREVDQTANTLAFRALAVNAFSVDGFTFSVDARYNRVGVGIAGPSPLSILMAQNPIPGNAIDTFSSGINNCGAPCGQGTARNMVLFNTNKTNTIFAGIDFVPSQNPLTMSGTSIYGIDRDENNNYAGLSFGTRNANNNLARMTIRSAGNVGIGTSTPNSSAQLEVSSANQGFLPPRLTTAQRDAINPKPAGLMIYNTDMNSTQYWNTNNWVKWIN